MVRHGHYEVVDRQQPHTIGGAKSIQIVTLNFYFAYAARYHITL